MSKIPDITMRRTYARWVWCAAAVFLLITASPEIQATEPAKDLNMAAGKKLYQNRCAKCHKMYNPAKYSDAQWELWMGKMEKKAKLRPEEKENLLKYVEETIRTPAKEKRNPAPTSSAKSGL